MRTRLVASIALPVALAAAGAVPALAASTKQVSVEDNFFRPSALTVAKGTTVTWTWKGQAPHNVTVTSGPTTFHSATQTSGTYSRRLTKAGTYRIVCTIHPGMTETLKVR